MLKRGLKQLYGLEAGVALGIFLVSDVLVVCHLSRMFLSSFVVTAVSDVMSSEFLCELLVSAVLSRTLVSVMFLVCGLVLVLSGLVSVLSGVLSVMSLVSGLVSAVLSRTLVSVTFPVCDLVSVVYGSC